MTIIKTKKELANYVKNSPVVIETKKAYEYDEEFDDIEHELVSLLATGDGSPDFGEDWEAWLQDHLREYLREAISIVM